MRNVSVIGAGTMGNGIAHVFAQNGFTVTLIDVNAAQLEKAIATIGKNFDRQVAKGTITEDVKTKALANISYRNRYCRRRTKCRLGSRSCNRKY